MARRPNRARLGWLVRLVAVLPVGGAVVLSFANLTDLARASRIEGWLAYLWPVTLDATGVVASLIWLDITMPAGARRSAMRLALAAVGLSIGGNSLWHWLLDTGHQPHVLIQMAVGAVPPAVLFLMLHVLHLAQRRPAQPANEPAALPASQSEPARSGPVGHFTVVIRQPGHLPGPAILPRLPAVASLPARRELADQPRLAIVASQPRAASQPTSEPASQPASRQPVPAWTAHLDRARQLLETQPAIGRAGLASQLGVPTSQARRLLDHLREPASQETR